MATATDAADSKETHAAHAPFDVPKKYQKEQLPDGKVRVHLSESFPTPYTMKNQPYGTHYAPADSRENFFSSLVLPQDVVEMLESNSGIKITGYIDIQPIPPDGQ